MPARRLLGLRMNAYRYNNPEHLSSFPHLVLDTTHLGTWGIDPLEFYRANRDRIAHVHLANYDFATGTEHRSPVDGDLSLGRLLRRLAGDGYRGAVTIEAGPGTIGASDVPTCREMLRGAVAFCRSGLAAPREAE
jgi:sugar phosphate isomerase/epimerase